jgi:hypothetical protein
LHTIRYLARGPSSIGLVARSSVGAAKAVKEEELRRVRAVKKIEERCIFIDGADALGLRG